MVNAVISSSRIKDSFRHIKNLKTSGTVTPSSGSLIRKMLAPIDFGDTRSVIELGPGNGCITEALLEHMRPDAQLLSLELNQEFADALSRLHDPRLKVFNACASSIRDILDELGIQEVDHVVSSLPLSLIDDEVVSAILASVNANLKPGGRFVQFQYSLKNYRDVKPHFSDVKLQFVLRNMPPAVMYNCVK